MEHLSVANQCFVNELYLDAAKLYSKALRKLMGQDQFNAYFGRAKCRMVTGDVGLVVSDLTECVSLDPKHQLSNFYLGFYLSKQNGSNNDYQTLLKSQKCLQRAKDNSNATNSALNDRIESTLAKVTSKLAKLPKPESQTTTDRVESSVDSSVKSSSNESLSNEEKQTESASATKTAQNGDKANGTDKSADAGNPVRKLRDTWYQSPSTVTYTLYIKNLTSQDVSITFLSDSLSYSLSLPNGETYNRSMKLFDAIDPDKSKFTVNKYKINCLLAKANLGTTWKDLEKCDTSETENGSASKKERQNGVSAPWTTNKNWDQVDKFAEQELSKDKPEGDEALQSLFQKIYSDGSDDQKKAMMKSFQTSGGTVLSTNWDDVRNKDYEGKDKVLPTGQDVREWEY